MKQICIPTQAMLSACQKVSGIIDNQQTMPILANVLIHMQNNKIIITSSDTEIELKATENVDLPGVDCCFTVSGRKLLDICKALQSESTLRITVSATQVTLKSGKSQFRLSCLPANEFPSFDSFTPTINFSITENIFYHLIKKTSFAMASTDVRYYLNGLLLEANQNQLTAVATDGHRLAISKATLDKPFSHKLQSLLPRKAALELLKLLDKNGENQLDISIGNHAIRIQKEGFCLLSKLIDGRFPDYEQAIPKYSQDPLVFDRETLKNALMRMAILSNEKVRGVNLDVNQTQLKISSANPDLGEAEETIDIDHGTLSPINIGLNVNYFLDVLNLVDSDSAHVFFKDSDSSILIEYPNDQFHGSYLIMPMCL